MKYNWPKIVDAFRGIVLSRVSFKGETPASEKDFMGYMREMVRSTDTFHPFDTDGELSRALNKMPDRCNYRNLKSYWAWKHGREAVADALYDMLYEVDEKIKDHFSDKWNFAPGYVPPKEVVFNVDEDTTNLVGQILSAARK